MKKFCEYCTALYLSETIDLLLTFCRLEWPVRTLSFSHDGKLLASGSEDQTIDIAYVETGEQVAHISVAYPTFTLAWVSHFICTQSQLAVSANYLMQW